MNKVKMIFMNIHSKVKDRIAILRARRNDESGYVPLEVVVVVAVCVIAIFAIGGMIAYSGIIHNEQTQNVAKETLIAYDAIYSAYSEKSEEPEDEEELKAVLKEATERYAAAREDEYTTIRSSFVDKGTITVIVKMNVNKQLHDEEALNGIKTVVGVFTTGDKEPESQFVKDTIINDNRILELN